MLAARYRSSCRSVDRAAYVLTQPAMSRTGNRWPASSK